MLLRQDRSRVAVAVMLDVAFHAGRGPEVARGEAVAERIGAAKRGIEPVFQALSRAGLLEGVRGPRGGYRLGRRARDIRLSEVVAAVAEDGTDAATAAATAAPGPVGRLQGAVVEPLWDELEAAVLGRLRALTLDDLLRRAREAGLRRPAAEPVNFAI